MWLCNACLALVLKGDLETTTAVLGVNINCKILQATLQKEYYDLLNEVGTEHAEPPCQAKGVVGRILQRKERKKPEDEGQSIWQQPRYGQAAQRIQGQLGLLGRKGILFDEGLLIHFFHLCYLVSQKMLSLPTDLVSEQPVCKGAAFLTSSHGQVCNRETIGDSRVTTAHRQRCSRPHPAQGLQLLWCQARRHNQPASA